MKSAGMSGYGQNSMALSTRSTHSQVHGKVNRMLRNGEVKENPNVHVLKAIFLSPICLLLICLPLGVYGSIDTHFMGATCRFWVNFLALIPLAKILGDATEELDASLNNEVVSGLINATLGNAVEMIITIFALKGGMVEMVKGSLLGSVLSNMLLVLGCSFFFGGIVGATPPEGKLRLVTEKEQVFGVGNALCSMSCLLLSCLSFALPSVFVVCNNDVSKINELSLAGSIIMVVSYVAYLVFQLITHKDTFGNDGDEGEDFAAGSAGSMPESDDHLSLPLSVLLLALTTVLTAGTSDFLVDAVKEMTEDPSCPMGELFIGIILLPFVGNACEHMAAVRFAVADRAGLAVSIAVGSSTQIAMFVVPFSVLMGRVVHVENHPYMDLNFGAMNTIVMLLSVLIVMSIVSDGRSNWLEGWLLIAAFTFVAVLYWFMPNNADSALVGFSEL